MDKLTIQEIAHVLVDKNGLTVQDANRFAQEMFSIIQQRLETDNLVKVKGLGTFKTISVEARESVSVRTGERVRIDSHTKVTFTPDTVMRELVNKPFSQFETVVLNDGVEFTDIPEEEEEPEIETLMEAEPEPEPIIEQEPEPVIEPEPEPVVEPEPEPVVEPEPEPVVEPEPEPVVEPEPEPVIEPEPEPVVEPEPEPEPVVEAKPVAAPVPHQLIDDEDDSDSDSDEDEEPTPWLRWLMYAVIGLLLLGIGAIGGYFARDHLTPAISDTIIIHDTLVIIEQEDSLADDEEIQTEEPVENAQPTPNAVENTQPKPNAVENTQPKPNAVENAQPKNNTVELDEYEKKDARIRLGAYRIVGLDHEVKVLAGQTFYSICRAHLGPDMSCYVEAYNNLPQNPQIKEGQVIRIPKLQLKKRRK